MMIDVVVVRDVDEIKLLCSLHEVMIMSKVMINHVILNLFFFLSFQVFNTSKYSHPSYLAYQ